MPNKFAHFAIEADDVLRAREFYTAVFGWTFEPWGPPDFYLIHGAGVHGALQKRAAAPSARSDVQHGYQCTFAVADVHAAMALVEAKGGTLNGGTHKLPTVGELASFTDTEGNGALLMQYEPEQLKEMNL